jgi:DNA-binding HxlR family transcriptional regulator
MATSRSYDDSCGVAHGLDIVGERWALLITRELMLGAKRFSDLKADLPGISSNVLSHRLDELERSAILIRRRLPKPAASWVYELTDWGYELEPVMQVLGRWAARSPSHQRDRHFGVTSLILSLRTNFDRDQARDVLGTFELRCGEDTFLARIAGRRLHIDRGAAADADVVIAGAPPMFASVIYGGRPLDEAVASGDLAVSGSQAAAAKFVSLFPLPATAPAPDELGALAR